MTLKTTHYSIILALILLLATAPMATAQKKPKASKQEAERQFNLTLIEDRIPSVLQFKDSLTAALTLGKIAVPLWKYDKDKAAELFVSALRLCDGLADEKMVMGCRSRTVNQIYNVDKEWFEKLIAETKGPGNPYAGVISDLLSKERPAEAAELIRKSAEKGFRDGVMINHLSRLRATDPKTADQLFMGLLESVGQLSSDEVLTFAVYPGRSGGVRGVSADNLAVNFPDLPADAWRELNPEIARAILGKAIEAKRDNEPKTFVMCSLMLSKARQLSYAADLAQSLETCVNSYKFPGLASELKNLNAPRMPENFDELLEKVASIPDVRTRNGEYGRLAMRALTAKKFNEAQRAISKIDDMSIGSYGLQIKEWLDFALAGDALREDAEKGKKPDFGFAEKIAARLGGAKSAWLWLAAGAGRRKEGDLAQARNDLMEGLKVARSLEDGKGPYLVLSLAAQFAISDKGSSPLDLVFAWSTFSEFIKSYNKNDPKVQVRPGENIQIPGVLSMFLSYLVFLDAPPEFNKDLLTFLTLDKQKTLQEIDKIEDERTLGDLYATFAAELLK